MINNNEPTDKQVEIINSFYKSLDHADQAQFDDWENWGDIDEAHWEYCHKHKDIDEDIQDALKCERLLEDFLHEGLNEYKGLKK